MSGVAVIPVDVFSSSYWKGELLALYFLHLVVLVVLDLSTILARFTSGANEVLILSWW